MSISDFTNGNDRAAEAGRLAGAEVGSLAQGAYDRNAAATHESQSANQKQAQTEGLVKDKVLPDVLIDGLKSSGEAMQSAGKIGEAIGEAFKPGEGQTKGGHSASTTGDAPPSSGSLPLPGKTVELSVRK